LELEIRAIAATPAADGGITYKTVSIVRFGKDASVHKYKSEANRLQAEFDADCDPVRVYVYEDGIPMFAALIAKASLCRILNVTDGGMYGPKAA